MYYFLVKLIVSEHLYSVLTPSSHHNGTTPLPTVGASDVDRQYYNSTNGRPAGVCVCVFVMY